MTYEINSIEEIDALPQGSIVLDRWNVAWRCTEYNQAAKQKIWYPADHRTVARWSRDFAYFPLTVLYASGDPV